MTDVAYVTQEMWDEAISLLSQAEASVEHFRTFREAEKWEIRHAEFMNKYSGFPDQSKGGE